ncbi:hypothetical protein Cpir12675_005957 [Ceratocystis pirilliformis]|uniref:AB hydrolase-1 domain-containing protein n=1 Tax=Ceratocystis pirilliformis TaxID=259994 RepID=A0ABR3YKW4_9PEZI
MSQAVLSTASIRALQLPVALTVATVSAYLYARPAIGFTPSPAAPPPLKAPSRAAAEDAQLSDAQRAVHAYPADILPGGRLVQTPYGAMNVYEWGPETGEKVLLLHGIGAPALALQDLAETLVAKGCRVMIFDLFGRGYSDAPSDLPFDERLYISQILLVLASSDLAWTGTEAFHLLGYSLGGALAVSFARYYPRMLKSLTLLSPGGLVRPSHFGLFDRLCLAEGLLPEGLIRWMMHKILTPWDHKILAGGEDRPVLAQTATPDFDRVVLSPANDARRQVGDTIWHQLDNHQGFLSAYLGTLRKAPVCDQGKPGGSWFDLRAVLEERRLNKTIPGLPGGRIIVVLADDDDIVDRHEMLADAKKTLGEEAMETVVIKGDHAIAITKGAEIAEKMVEYWNR